MRDGFYMLYAEGRSAPKIEHATLAAAFKEAERLAREGIFPVWVLKAIAVCTVGERPVAWADIETPGALPDFAGDREAVTPSDAPSAPVAPAEAPAAPRRQGTPRKARVSCLGTSGGVVDTLLAPSLAFTVPTPTLGVAVSSLPTAPAAPAETSLGPKRRGRPRKARISSPDVSAGFSGGQPVAPPAAKPKTAYGEREEARVAADLEVMERRAEGEEACIDCRDRIPFADAARRLHKQASYENPWRGSVRTWPCAGAVKEEAVRRPTP